LWEIGIWVLLWASRTISTRWLRRHSELQSRHETFGWFIDPILLNDLLKFTLIIKENYLLRQHFSSSALGQYLMLLTSTWAVHLVFQDEQSSMHLSFQMRWSILLESQETKVQEEPRKFKRYWFKLQIGIPNQLLMKLKRIMLLFMLMKWKKRTKMKGSFQMWLKILQHHHWDLPERELGMNHLKEIIWTEARTKEIH